MKQTKGKELAELEDKLFKYKGEDKIISSLELAEELKKTQNAVFNLKTGIETMDKILNGVEMGELVIVTGPTGEGKTTCLMTITKNLAEQNVNTAWFTLEVTPRQFIQKIGKGGNLPLFYLPSKNTENHIKWIEERIIEAKVKYNVQAVFIDHIHSIFSLARVQNNVSLEIGDMVAKIKDMAIQLNLVIFLVAHSKDPVDGSNREPKKEDIRDSGLISRLADTILGIWRIQNTDDGSSTMRKPQNSYDNHSKVRIFKNRREGTLGHFIMEHKDHYLIEIDPFKNSGF